MEEKRQIDWLKFAEHLRENYTYLLDFKLCLQIAEDAKRFVEAETEAR